ncbi:MAG: hypothetical protein EON87_08670 [Brevundimonas sp.]|nr:MAG: hypothetical protein EON87_08670 [Brevundimonas sp.]
MTTKKTEAGDAPANLKPATEFEASGAVIEPGIVTGVDMSHPSIDANPREKSTADMNRIDLNTPSALQSEEDQVVEELKSQD